MPVVARNEEELRYGIRYFRSIGAFSPHARVAWLFKYGGSVIAMMTLGVLMGYKRIILCGVDLNKQDYFYQDPRRYPECAGWEFVSRNEAHLTTRRLPWLVPAQSAVHIYKELVLDPANIELFVESRASTLYPQRAAGFSLAFRRPRASGFSLALLTPLQADALLVYFPGYWG